MVNKLKLSQQLLSFMALFMLAQFGFAQASESSKEDTSMTEMNLAGITSAIPPYESLKLKKLAKDASVKDYLELAQAQFATRNYRDCTTSLRAIESKVTDPLLTWVVRKRLLCEIQVYERGDNNLPILESNLKDMLERWQKAPDYLRAALKQPIYTSSIILFSKFSRLEQASFMIDYYQENQKNYKPESIVTVFSRAAEIAEKENKKSTALQYYLLAYEYSNKSSRLKNKIRDLDPDALPADVVKESTEPPSSISQAEKKAYNDFDRQYRLRNYILGIEKAVDYLSSYPEGEWANTVGERVSDVYLKMSAGRSDKLLLARQKAVDKMREAPEGFLYDWSLTMFYRERYADIDLLLKPYIEEHKEPAKIAAKLLLYQGLANLHQGNYKSALQYFEMITRDHAGSESVNEAYFRAGLVHYRLKNFNSATQAFQQYLSQTVDGDFEVSSLYWQWRAQIEIKDKQASKTLETLLDRYPLSYFGLRASVEVYDNKKVLISNKANNVTKIRLPLTAQAKQSWVAIKSLISASWLEEAEIEIDRMKTFAHDPKAQVFISKLYARIYHYVKASITMWPALRGNPKLNVKENLTVIFPNQFLVQIKEQAKRYDMDPFLVQGLIRQESSYHHDAISHAGARGLMQLLYRTAKEIARDMRIRSFNRSSDLLEPDTNIKIGTNYIYRLKRAFDGNTSLALASYNAGIGNMRAWLKNRQDLEPESMTTASPDSELWMDELPWLETSGYVKNVLRNWVIYSLMDDPKTKVKFPIK